ncbi:MAG: hypothetical protein ACLFSV_02165 [Alkalispirochaeta sp.]
MNAATVVLLVLAIHFGGAEIDTADTGTIRWFSDSQLRETWNLVSESRGAGGRRQVPFPGSLRSQGLYLFRNDTETVAVQRLATPDLTFTVTRSDAAGNVAFVSSVNIDRAAGSDSSRGSLSATEVLVAFASRGEDIPDSGASDRGNGTTPGGIVEPETDGYGSPGDDPDAPDPEVLPLEATGSGDAVEGEQGVQGAAPSNGSDPEVYRIDLSDGTVSVSDTGSGQIILVNYR